MFNDIPSSLTVECPEVGENNILKRKHTPFEEDEIPTLIWSSDAETLQKIKEFILIVEDPDGLYYGIPSTIRYFSHKDLLAIKNDESTGMKYGLNFRKNLYLGAKPIINHSQYRYFFQIVGL